MPAVPPGQPIAPGIAASNSGYPQYGVGGGLRAVLPAGR